MAALRLWKGMAGRRKAKGIWRFLRPVAFALAALVAIPVVLTPVYLFVDPVSVRLLQGYITGRRVEREWRDFDNISDGL